jgi:hypothetical protein
MEAQEQDRIVDWRMLLVHADEIQYFKALSPAFSADSILRALAVHGLDRKSVAAELRAVR